MNTICIGKQQILIEQTRDKIRYEACDIHLMTSFDCNILHCDISWPESAS